MFEMEGTPPLPTSPSQPSPPSSLVAQDMADVTPDRDISPDTFHPDISPSTASNQVPRSTDATSDASGPLYVPSPSECVVETSTPEPSDVHDPPPSSPPVPPGDADAPLTQCHRSLRQIQRSIDSPKDTTPKGPAPQAKGRGAEANLGIEQPPPLIHSQLAKRKLVDCMQSGPDAPIPTIETPAMTPSPTRQPSRPASSSKRPASSMPLSRVADNGQSPNKRARKPRAFAAPSGLTRELEMVKMPAPDDDPSEPDETVLLLDAANTKVSLIAFGPHGPLNQGRWGSKVRCQTEGDDDEIESESQTR